MIRQAVMTDLTAIVPDNSCTLKETRHNGEITTLEIAY